MKKQLEKTSQGPSWDKLWNIASLQSGLFTTSQAQSAGYSRALLAKYLKNNRIFHLRRSIYRITHFPHGEHENLVELWLWSENQGIFSHETALSLHGLSDNLPTKIHMSLPLSWQNRRLRVPDGLVLAFKDVPTNEISWDGSIPMTNVTRTLLDCVTENISPEIIQSAYVTAIQKGILQKNSLPIVTNYLSRFISKAPKSTHLKVKK